MQRLISLKLHPAEQDHQQHHHQADDADLLRPAVGPQLAAARPTALPSRPNRAGPTRYSSRMMPKKVSTQPTAKDGHASAIRMRHSVCHQLAPWTREHSSRSKESCAIGARHHPHRRSACRAPYRRATAPRSCRRSGSAPAASQTPTGSRRRAPCPASSRAATPARRSAGGRATSCAPRCRRRCRRAPSSRSRRSRPSSMVLRKRAPELAVAEHRAIMIERQHVPAVEAEELEERSDQRAGRPAAPR